MATNETRIENHEAIHLPGFNVVSQFKRSTVAVGGVCIYENDESDLQAKPHELLKFDEAKKEIKRISTAHDGIGDICSIEAIIDNKRVLIISVYISPKTTKKEIVKFFTFNLLAYSSKLKGLFECLDEEEYYKIPIILCGDFNINFQQELGLEFRKYMLENFGLELNNDPAIAKASKNTSIDGVFTRYLDNIETKHYISYFSYHRPLITISNN